MPTIDYKPMDLAYLVPGINPVGGGTVPPLWERLCNTDRWVHTTHTPSLFSSTFGLVTGTSTGATSAASSGSPEVLGRWIVMGNAERRTVTVSVWALVDNAGTSGTLRASYGGATVSVAVTATTAALHTIDVRPTSGSAPLELSIDGYTDDANSVVLVAASAQLKAEDRSAGGADSSGYAPMGDTYDAAYQATSPAATNKPISTELVSRAWNNCRAIARDRVACLATIQHPHNTVADRQGWSTDGGDPALVGVAWVPPGATYTPRTFRVSWYVVASGTAAGTAVLLAGGSEQASVSVTTAGAWVHSTITMGVQGGPVSVSAAKTSGAGYVALLALQVFREP